MGLAWRRAGAQGRGAAELPRMARHLAREGLAISARPLHSRPSQYPQRRHRATTADPSRRGHFHRRTIHSACRAARGRGRAQLDPAHARARARSLRLFTAQAVDGDRQLGSGSGVCVESTLGPRALGRDPSRSRFRSSLASTSDRSPLGARVLGWCVDLSMGARSARAVPKIRARPVKQVTGRAKITN